MATKLERGGKVLVAGPLKKEHFFSASLTLTLKLRLRSHNKKYSLSKSLFYNHCYANIKEMNSEYIARHITYIAPGQTLRQQNMLYQGE